MNRTPHTLRGKKRTLPMAGTGGGGAVRRLFASLDAELATARLTEPKMLQLVYPELLIPQKVPQLNYTGPGLASVSFELWGVCDPPRLLRLLTCIKLMIWDQYGAEGSLEAKPLDTTDSRRRTEAKGGSRKLPQKAPPRVFSDKNRLSLNSQNGHHTPPRGTRHLQGITGPTKGVLWDDDGPLTTSSPSRSPSGGHRGDKSKGKTASSLSAAEQRSREFQDQHIVQGGNASKVCETTPPVQCIANLPSSW